MSWLAKLLRSMRRGPSTLYEVHLREHGKQRHVPWGLELMNYCRWCRDPADESYRDWALPGNASSTATETSEETPPGGSIS